MTGEWTTATVVELQRRGILFVEDGNHGEYRPLADEFVEIGIPFIRPDDLRDGRVDFANCDRINDRALARVRKGKGRSGDIVFTHRATVGRIARIGLNDPPFVANPGVTVWRSNAPDVLDPVYLYFFMQTSAFMDQVWAEAGNTDTFPYVSLTQQRGLKISMPCIGRQRAIAYILGTLDDKIELNRRMNETLEAIARALFKSWLVDFDPVGAKAEGRDPGLPKHIADLFPDHFEDSELGEIPVGWAVGCLGDVAEHPRRGVQPHRIDPNTPYIALEHMPKRCIALSDWGTAEGLESNKFEFKTGEILFGKLRPYFHKVGVAPVDGVCSTDIVIVAPRSEDWFGFVLGNVSSDAFVEYTNAGSTGTKMPRTSWGDMARYAIAVPPEPVAAALTDQLRPLVDRVISGIHESRTLAALRDALLPELISGELPVKDAERVIAGGSA
jgi:type I restriction enzyme, S subunit